MKTGPVAYGLRHFVAADSLLPYTIHFENETNATAPAQQVALSDPLPKLLDRNMFEVTEIAFGDHFIVVPPHTQNFETNVPITCAGMTFRVQIEAGIQFDSGLVYAIFRSVDPATSLPPPVNIGFLPPEDGTGRGQGHVSYTIRPQANLRTGTEIRNVALIRFDRGETIATNQRDPHNAALGIDLAKECLITSDAGAPTSRVLPLPTATDKTTFLVQWSGQDDPGGSGIAGYNIYVKDNNQAWALWKANTTETSANFTGQIGHTYAFYSAAQHNVGNREAAHATPDAVTQIPAQVPVALTITVTNETVAVSWPTSAVGFSLEFTESLMPPIEWQLMSNLPVIVGDLNTVPVQPTNAARCYRLVKH
jgi:hypothetical protein